MKSPSDDLGLGVKSLEENRVAYSTAEGSAVSR